MVQEKFERLHVALPTSAGIPFTTRIELPPRQSGHRISNRISNKPETMKLNEEQLQMIINAHLALGVATDNAVKAGCLDVNGPLFDAVWRGFEKVVSLLDEGAWVSWFVYDNDMGKRGLTVTINEKKMKVKTVKTLLKIINS